MLEKIKNFVESNEGVNLNDDIHSRQIFCYLCDKLLRDEFDKNYTQQKIAKFIGQSHSTINHSIKQVETMIEINDNQGKRAVDYLERLKPIIENIEKENIIKESEIVKSENYDTNKLMVMMQPFMSEGSINLILDKCKL